jgi:hypothetical protein
MIVREQGTGNLRPDLAHESLLQHISEIAYQRTFELCIDLGEILDTRSFSISDIDIPNRIDRNFSRAFDPVDDISQQSQASILGDDLSSEIL